MKKELTWDMIKSDTMSAYFEKMLHQRLRFQGTYSGYKVFKKKDRKRTIVYYIISLKTLSKSNLNVCLEIITISKFLKKSTYALLPIFDA